MKIVIQIVWKMFYRYCCLRKLTSMLYVLYLIQVVCLNLYKHFTPIYLFNHFHYAYRLNKRKTSCLSICASSRLSLRLFGCDLEEIYIFQWDNEIDMLHEINVCVRVCLSLCRMRLTKSARALLGWTWQFYSKANVTKHTNPFWSTNKLEVKKKKNKNKRDWLDSLTQPQAKQQLSSNLNSHKQYTIHLYIPQNRNAEKTKNRERKERKKQG